MASFSDRDKDKVQEVLNAARHGLLKLHPSPDDSAFTNTILSAVTTTSTSSTAPAPAPASMTSEASSELRRVKLHLMARVLSLWATRATGRAWVKWRTLPKSEDNPAGPDSSKSNSSTNITPIEETRSRSNSTSSQKSSMPSTGELETLVSDLRNQIEEAANDKKRNQQDFRLAWELIKQLKRENATLAYQVKNMLPQTKTGGMAAPAKFGAAGPTAA